VVSHKCHMSSLGRQECYHCIKASCMNCSF